MTSNTVWLRTSYTPAFRGYLLEPTEAALRPAYELGREAVGRELGVLDLAVVHHEALLFALAAAESDDVEEIARRGAAFFLESLSAFEMVQRGFREAREAALVERRQAGMLRQLSSLLADASLALEASDSLEEMLRLVAEVAREMTGAEWCEASATFEGERQTVKVASDPDVDFDAPGFGDEKRLSAVDARAASADRGGVRGRETGAGAEVAEPRAGADGRRSLAAPLTTLDGRELGSVELFKESGGFAEVDEAVLVHLAQMASAALERAGLYLGAR